MNKSKTNISVKSNTGTRVKSNIIIGEHGTFTSGDILDANATAELVQDKVGEVIGGAGEDFDTLKEVADVIMNKTTLEPFPETWTATSFDNSIVDLGILILNDNNIKEGLVYYGEVNSYDLPVEREYINEEPLLTVDKYPVKVYIDQVGLTKKLITFVLNTAADAYKFSFTSVKTGLNWNNLLPVVQDSTKWISMTEDISGKADIATTLDGYGITDAKIEGGVITLGSNTITPATKTRVDLIEEVESAALTELHNEIEGIKYQLLHLGNTTATSIDLENIPSVDGYSMILVGAGAPTAVPRFVGQFYIDTTNSKLYCAKAITNSTADWFQA